MLHKVKDQLTDTAQNFFSYTRTVCKVKKDWVHEYFDIRKQCEDLLGSTCGLFQLYFYKNLFDPDEKAKF